MKIKLYPPVAQPFRAQDYILHEELKNAVEVAIALRQPLLLTGEPGTGKTKLAYKVALDLAEQSGGAFADAPLIFNTKTTSSARDLFYTYDAVSHFQAANLKGADGQSQRKTADFIELQALGKAIAFTNPGKVDQSRFSTPLPDAPQNSVVLIDEIDKAPRDFTNDILDEIENYRFSIKEQDNYRIQKDPDRQILVIMTSNSEKNLPDPFLRRCVFYHIPFPNEDLLRDIVKTQLGGSTTFTDQALNMLIDRFNAVRKKAVRKAPATAELIAWLRILEMHNFMEAPAEKQRRMMLDNLSILVKTREDLEAVAELF